MTVSVTSMKLVFPEFATLDPAQIQFAIDEASRGVDSAIWFAKDIDRGQMYLAAHFLIVAIQRAESATGQKIKSERIGADFSVTYADDPKQQVADPDDYTSTSYGSRYLALLQANVPAVAII